MYGSWRWNICFGLVGLVFVFLLGLANNPWSTSLVRGVYSFILFFILAYGVRYIIGSLIATDETKAEVNEEVKEDVAGSNIDYVTPDGDEDLNSILREQMAQGKAVKEEEPINTQDTKAAQFQPLTPKKLVSTDKMQAEDLTRAVRHLTGE